MTLLGLIEIILADAAGLPNAAWHLGGFRVLRLFFLAKAWTLLDGVLVVLANTAAALASLALTFGFGAFAFAAAGEVIFSDAYNKSQDGELPRWNFKDFWHRYQKNFVLKNKML